MEPQLVELDSRKRASLARLGADHRFYLARRESDGTIVLTPASVQSELEARLHRNSELTDRLREQVTAPERYLVKAPKGRRQRTDATTRGFRRRGA